MIEQEYTSDDLKKAMLNEACPKMEAFFSDLYDDFQEIDNMEVGQTAQWFYRKNGTSFWVENPERFLYNLEFWKSQVFEAITILKTESGMFSVTEFNIKKALSNGK